MHSIVLFTAMTATSGLFGGHRQVATSGCAGGSCARPAAVAYSAPSACQTGTCGTSYGYGYRYAAPTGYAAPAPAQYAPAPTAYAAPAPAAYSPAPAVSYNSYYYPAATCTTGSCPRR